MTTRGWMVRVLLALVVTVAAGCATELNRVERTTRGPSAEELMLVRAFAINGRTPNFEEKRHWERAVEERVYTYLRDHPELQQAARYTEFRFLWQVTPGSTPAEVRVLLEEPQDVAALGPCHPRRATTKVAPATPALERRSRRASLSPRRGSRPSPRAWYTLASSRTP